MMMTLIDVLSWLKTLNTNFDNYYIGTLDAKKEKSLGVYNLKNGRKPIAALGGKENSSYNIKSISLLVHWNKATDSSENKAISLYEELLEATPTIIGKHEINFVGMLNNEPIDIGRDDSGICEYVIDFEIYYKR